ncbi:unknown protein [Cronobacter turicensis z3032]|uniref:Uncharacterized protein n=1 Tax=Cronobacter turicensis (strain DSM 18703 / CCUG 55852 / LMG 23827 / z3032) TaxID=693216 RepID=C9Y426_CROTZ|nr:unknown protein [Cronobacter turicensis z3032]
MAGLVGSNRESHSVFLPGVISAQTSWVLSDVRRLCAKEQSRACALPVTACRGASRLTTGRGYSIDKMYVSAINIIAAHKHSCCRAWLI